MGNVAEQFAAAFRDFVTDGVPASGEHEPVKAEIRALGPTIETAIGTVGIGALVDVVYATRAALNGDLAHPANSVALVYADTTDANNDLYVKSGPSGSGSWGLTDALHSIAEGLYVPFLQQAETLLEQQVAIATEKSQLAEAYATQPFGQPIPGEPAGNRSALHFAEVARTLSARSRNAAGFATRADLLSATDMVGGDVAIVFDDSGQHSAVAGEFALGGAAATVGAQIENEGRYTYRASPAAWLRTGDTDAQKARAAARSVGAFIPALLTGSALTQNTVYRLRGPVLQGLAFSRVTLEVVGGTGTAQIMLLVNGAAETGALTAGTTSATFDVDLTVLANDRLEIAVGTITGSPTAVLIQIEGVAE